MNERIVYYSKFNSNISEKFYNETKKLIANGKEKNFYFIFPNGRLLEKYRQKYLDDLGGVFNPNILTFDDIVSQINQNKNYTLIGESFKLLILRKIISQENLAYFKNTKSDGFLKVISEVIREIKQSLIGVRDFEQIKDLKPVFKDIHKIYLKYENYLNANKLVDRESLYYLAIDELEKGFKPEDIEEIYVDYFYDFRPIELKILEELFMLDCNIRINIPFKKLDKALIVSDTIKMLKKIGFDIVIEETKDLSLEELFFIEDREGFKINNTKSINILASPTKSLEVKRVYQFIKDKLSQGYLLKDIGVITLDEEYRNLLIEKSKEEKIPLNIETSKPSTRAGLLEDFLNLIKINLKDRDKMASKNTILDRINNKHFSINLSNQQSLKNYIRGLNFDDIKDLSHKFDTSQSFQVNKDILDDLIIFIGRLEKEREEFKKLKKIGDFNKFILDKIEEYKVKEKILLGFNKNEEKFYEDFKAFEILLRLLETYSGNSFKNLELDKEEYYQLMILSLEEESIRLRKKNKNGLNLLDLIEARGMKYKIGIVLGMSEDIYPRPKKESFFFNENNLEYLRSIGFTYKDDEYEFENEIIKFSTFLASISESFLFTYSKGIEGENISSQFLDEVVRLDQENIREEKVDFDYMIKNKLEDLTTMEELCQYILSSYYNEIKVDDELIYLNNKIFPGRLDNIKDKISFEYNRSMNIFDEYSGVFKREDTIKEIKSKINKTYSSTGLEIYANCPYSYMLNNILFINEEEEEIDGYNNLAIGSIYHNVLRDFFSDYREDIHRHIDGDRKFNLEGNLLKPYIIDHFSKFYSDVNLMKNRLLIETIEENLIGYISFSLDRAINEEMYPIKFEEEFKIKEDLIEDGKKDVISIRGRIDRIDKFKDNRIVIIDYKTSSSGISLKNQVIEGLAYQMPIYIKARLDKNPLLAIYDIIKTGESRLALGLPDDKNFFTKRSSGYLKDKDELKDILEGVRSNILNIHKSIEKGYFPVKPHNCSEYCPYKEICRYKEVISYEA